MKTIVIVLATLIHLVPRPFGVSPVGAMALYSGAYGSKRYSWLLPLIPLTLAAFIFGFYEPVVMAFVFVAFALSTFAGRWFLSDEKRLSGYGFAIGTGAAIFFLVANLGNWYAFRPHTIDGLVQCYLDGLPYLFQALAADAFFCYVLFGAHWAMEKMNKVPVTA